jgi:dipeptidyl aminopeptidase/acylaminoacyl peptidase
MINERFFIGKPAELTKHDLEIDTGMAVTSAESLHSCALARLNRTSSLRLLRIAVLMLSGLSVACAQNTAKAAPQNTIASRAATVMASMPKAKHFEQTEISPDGKLVAWIAEGKVHIEGVEVLRGATGIDLPLPEGLDARELAWAPDSKKIALIADEKGEVPASQVWLMEPWGKGSHKLASLRGYVSAPRFSPDGKSLAVLIIENMPRMAGPLVPMTPPAGVMEEQIFEQRIAVFDLVSGAIKQVSPADLYVYEYDWAPDGKSWVISAAHGSGDDNWYIARLYTLDANGGALHELVKPPLQIAVPRFSPDGQQIAYIAGIMSDEGSTGGDIFVVAAAGGEPRNVTPGLKASATWLTWTSPEQILFTENIDGNSGIATVKPAGATVEQLWSGPEMLSADGWGIQISLARDGQTSAVVRQSYSSPPQVWAGPIGTWRLVTPSINADMKPAWGEARNVSWTNDGMRMQGWLLLPKDYDAGKKYPLIVWVHGGPSAACTSRWSTAPGAASAMGWFVLCPNPRGSYGQGEAFTQANVKDFGGGDFRDIMAGVDALAKEYPIDLDRLGIHGHSYGGYMTMWAETQTTRFKAAVAGAGLSDWLSYYGENYIDGWMIPFFGASVYDDPAIYAKSSPIEFVKNVKTPTLILVGDRDGEVPIPQSFEWWHALKTLGVPVEFVVYPNEGHAISQPEHRHDYDLRTLEWFEKWFGDGEKR